MHGIYAYNTGSKGARLLARALRVPIIRRNRSTFVGNQRKTVINWGSQTIPPQVANCRRVYNTPDCVALASNKLRFFNRVQANERVNIPRFTSNRQTAQGWNTTVVVRHTVTGQGGAGIEVKEPGQQLPNAPLYTEYIKKDAEFRIHVVNGAVVDATRKVARDRNTVTNWQIRSHDNGFIFQRGGTDTHPGYRKACDQALLAVRAVGLDFGGVDVIYNARQDKAYVLEVNTAPGIEGQTVEAYRRAFANL